MKCTIKKRFYSFNILAFSIILLVMYGITVSVLFIRQQVIVLGITTNYVEQDNINKLINEFFHNPSSQTHYAEGLVALSNSGYSGFSQYYLLSPLLPILTFIIICLIGAIFFHIWATRRAKEFQQNEEQKLLAWIRSKSTDEITASICSDSILYAISEQKRLIQKQDALHNEDTAKIMHYMEDISHQLKTPLTVMQVACERLAMCDEISKPTAEICLLQISKMTQMIQDLLQLGRFDCNKQKKKFVYANAQELMETVTNNLVIIASPKNIDFEISGDPFAVFFCDTYWVKEAVGNILKNCIEHSSNSKILIHYECNGASNHIQIEDHGSGFKSGFEEQIFQRYAFRRSSKGNGSGLGMAIAQEAIKMHYGIITASNRPEGGAIFRISFPRLDADAIYS